MTMKPLFTLILCLWFAATAFSAPFPSWITSSKWSGSIEHKQTGTLDQIRVIVDPRYKPPTAYGWYPQVFTPYDVHSVSRLSIQQNRRVIKLVFAQLESPRTYVFHSNGAVTAFIPNPSTGNVIACWGTWYRWHDTIYYRYVDEATTFYAGMYEAFPSIITTGSFRQLSKRRVAIEESGSEQHQVDYYFSATRDLSFSGKFYIERQSSH
jgi:hypothetical protein